MCETAKWPLAGPGGEACFSLPSPACGCFGIRACIYETVCLVSRRSSCMPETAASLVPTRVRYLVLAMLFVVTTLNFADRATLSIAGPAVAGQLGLGAVAMGYVFSAFGWAYVFGQIPGGLLLDRFGSKNVYTLSILAWSLVTALQGFVGYLDRQR